MKTRIHLSNYYRTSRLDKQDSTGKDYLWPLWAQACMEAYSSRRALHGSQSLFLNSDVPDFSKLRLLWSSSFLFNSLQVP